MKNISLLFTTLLFANFLQAQPVTKGNWTVSLFDNNITQLQWSYTSMPRNEHIGDAVILKAQKGPVPLSQAQAITKTAVGKGRTVGGNKNTAPLQFSATANGVKMQTGAAIMEVITAFDSGHIRGIRFKMPEGAAWFGGGERSLPMNRVGQRIQLYNNPHYGYELNADELNYSVPFILTTNGYGLLFDNPAKGYLDFGKTTPEILEAAFVSGDVNVYIIPGKTPAEIIQHYAALTGKQPLPPRWALGNFVSRFGYRSQQQVIDVVNKMKADSFPVDAVVIDIFWFGDSIKGTLGNLDWMNKKKWPSPEKMIANFNKQHVNPILVTEPFFLQGTKNFEASKPYMATDSIGAPFMLTDFYFGYGGLLDLFKPESRAWFWNFYKTQTDNGVAGWWGDLGEPEKHPQGMYHNLSSFGVKRKMAADEVHNMYGHMWSKMLYENWRSAYPNKRLFYLNRAGFAGSQRYSVFPWTGDVSRSWNGLRAQLPNLQSMSLSGVPYIHSDAGGFSNAPTNDQELYVRWVQMAGFTPVFRPHGTAFGDLEPGVNDLPSEPAFKDEPYKSIAREVIRLRYSLLPYLYTLAWAQAAKGNPFIRPMIYNGATDTALLQATDQYMFGDALLIAPVLEPGATTRKLYLPEGQWYALADSKMINGKQWINEPVTLQKMPVFVKAGSFVPMWQNATAGNTAAYSQKSPLNIRYYPGQNAAASFLYDDDGENPDALKTAAAHQLLSFTSSLENDKLTIHIAPVNWPAGNERTLNLQMPDGTSAAIFNLATATILLNGKPMNLQPEGDAKNWLQLPIHFTGEKITIVFTKQ